MTHQFPVALFDSIVRLMLSRADSGSPTALSAELGFGRRTISKLLSGESRTTPHALRRLLVAWNAKGRGHIEVTLGGNKDVVLIDGARWETISPC